uniref:Uncharacterized protein n=1 Tax=Cacopsylla melanoneura TaxID=428564 RepID=A0A8D9EDS1_9HEMI
MGPRLETYDESCYVTHGTSIYESGPAFYGASVDESRSAFLGPSDNGAASRPRINGAPVHEPGPAINEPRPSVHWAAGASSRTNGTYPTSTTEHGPRWHGTE